MKYQLRKFLTKPIKSNNKWNIDFFNECGDEFINKLKCYLPNFMAGIIDPDINPDKPEGYIQNLHNGRLGDFSQRYIIVAYDKHVPVGILIGLMMENQKLHIYSIGVSPAYRKCGVASELLIKCINDMIDHGIVELILDVHEDNKPAFNLYQKFGFR